MSLIQSKMLVFSFIFAGDSGLLYIKLVLHSNASLCSNVSLVFVASLRSASLKWLMFRLINKATSAAIMRMTVSNTCRVWMDEVERKRVVHVKHGSCLRLQVVASSEIAKHNTSHSYAPPHTGLALCL